MKISFIIPAHNAADTLVRAVRSILGLFHGSVLFEILIVENGSGDDTLRLAAELADRYAEVVLLRSESGVSKARNVGIRYAGGDWICFVDADDQCEPGAADAIPLLEKYAPELLVSGYRKGQGTVSSRFRVCNRLIPGEELEAAKAWMISAPTLRMTVWAKFFRRDFLIANDLFFDEALTRSEDSEFLLRVLDRCRKMLVTDLVTYRYSPGPSSVTGSVSRGIASSFLEALRKADDTAAAGSPGLRAAYPDYVYSQIMLAAVHDFYDPAVRVPWSDRDRNMLRFLEEGPVKRAVARMRFRNLLHPRNWPVFLFKCRLIRPGGAVCCLRSLRNRRLRRREEQGRRA